MNRQWDTIDGLDAWSEADRRLRAHQRNAPPSGAPKDQVIRYLAERARLEDEADQRL